jgi:phospholipase/carboxylesterase
MVGFQPGENQRKTEQHVALSKRKRPEPDDGQIAARPGVPSARAEPGLHRLGLDDGRDALLYVPARLVGDGPAPFVLMLHGAGGSGGSAMGIARVLADELGVVVLAPDSRGRTWDIILGEYGPDVAFLERALKAVFSRCALDAKRMAVGGFSDGASYALSLGVANGDLFTHVLAFSPGFMAPPAQRGAPHIYMSHGSADTVLPIDRCSRRLVPRLQTAGYALLYREFEGPHTVPAAVAREAFQWFADGTQPV